jgi:phage gpG-like protein
MIEIRVELDLRSALGRDATRKKNKLIAELLKEQTLDRIQTGGDDEIRFTPLKYPRPTGDKDNPLYDTGTHLHDSITHGTDPDGPWVGSTFIGANVHQFGTKGKGGRLPPIVPKKAKALFIPLTPLAAKSVGAFEAAAGRPGGIRKVRKGVRRRGGRRTFVDLEKGKDFILVQKVEIPPRPFLRVSPQNLSEIAEIIGGGEPKR